MGSKRLEFFNFRGRTYRSGDRVRVFNAVRRDYSATLYAITETPPSSGNIEVAFIDDERDEGRLYFSRTANGEVTSDNVRLLVPIKVKE